MANYKLPPRQKMINLLYVILIAMLAISISVEVLDGFNTVNIDLHSNIEALKEYNNKLEQQLKDEGKTAQVEQLAPLKNDLVAFGKLCEELGEQMHEIFQENSFSDKIEMDDDQNAVRTVMLTDGNATKLKNGIESFKQSCLALTGNEASRNMIESLLDTRAYGQDKTWEEEHFENMPFTGSQLVMNSIEKDMWIVLNEITRQAGTLEGLEENQTIAQKQETEKEQAENEPEKDYDFQTALIKQLEKQQKDWKGVKNKVIMDKDGKVKALVMMENSSPLFANYENVVNITVIPEEEKKNLKVSVTNGKVQKQDDHYIVIPDGKAKTAKLSLTEGKERIAEYDYEIISLPIPRPLLLYTAPNGAARTYRSGVPLSRKEIMSISEIKLNMDEGIDTKEKVASFDLMLVKNGNKTIITEHAEGSKLTPAMKKTLENVVKGDKLFFTNIKIKGKTSPERLTLSVSVIPM